MSRRPTAACAVLVCATLTSPASAREARQLQQLTGAVAPDVPGPLERSAKAITPENPIPRRTHWVAPQYPPEAASIEASASIAIRLTLDVLGQVAEVRPVGATLGASSATPPPGAPPMLSVLEALHRSAMVAAGQWLYEPPTDGPIAFDVVIAFQPGAEPKVVAHGIVAAPSSERAAAPPPLAPPAPPAPPAPWAEGAVWVGGNVKPPAKVTHVNPIYPEEARQAGARGVVMIEIRIEPDGRVDHARILRSVQLLDQAALDAVLQWEFVPTELDGRSIPVLTLVTIQFSLP